MSTELITGHGGTPHISSEDVGNLLAGVIGEDSYCLGASPTVTMVDANTVSISQADLVLNGRHVRIKETENVTIESGSVGYYRHDLIICRYEYNSSTRVESVRFLAITGTAAATSAGAVDPTTEYMNQSILDGALIVDIPIVRIVLNGLTPTATWLLGVTQTLYDNSQAIVDVAADVADIQSSLDAVDGKLLYAGLGTISMWVAADKQITMVFYADLAGTTRLARIDFKPNSTFVIS